MACNTKNINTANVITFGFATSFDPYAKTVTLDIAADTVFETGGEANITNIAWTITDPLNEDHTGSINPSDSETEVEIIGLPGASLFFGNYHVKGVLTEADASTYEIEFDINICRDERLTASNFVKGCLEVNVDCGRAVMEVYEKTNFKFNGKAPDNENLEYEGSVIYPENYLPQVNFSFAPYSLDLTDSITGMYQIIMLTTATYDLDCGVKLLIQFRSKVNQDVQCGASMCEISCCWVDSLAIVEKGGTKGAQMEEKMQMASYYYNGAMALWSCGKPNEFFIQKVKEILNCDCQCDKAVLIQPRPITYGAKNLIPSCGTSISIDENGDYKFHSFVYVIVPGDDKLTINTVQTNSCTKTTTISLNCAEVERCLYDYLADSDNEAILLQWQDLLNISKCPCEDVTIENTPELLSLGKLTDDFSTLQDTNFVKNDIITDVNYKDNTVVTGGTFQYAKYYDQIIQQLGVVNTAGANFTLPCAVCGETIADKSGKLLSEVHTNCGCVEQSECDLTTPRVDFSERYESAYRFNPQIEEPCYTTYTEIIDGDPYTMYKVYFGDTAIDATRSAVRVAIIKVSNIGEISLHETRTILGGIPASIANITTNNTWGNMVSLNRPSAINLDFDEIVNGEPVLYFTTFSGYICRAVRERSSECDERANWKVYVIGETGHSLYGLKKFILDANGNRSFIYFDTTDSTLYALTYDNTGSKNSSANWTSTDIDIAVVGDGTNFNVEITKNWIFAMGDGLIKLVIYTGTTVLSNIVNPANYTEYPICNILAGSPTTYVDGIGSLASVSSPTWMQKIVVGGEDRYYFGNADVDIANNYIKLSMLRYMVLEHGGDPTLQDSWTFSTDIISSNNSILADGTWNSSTNVNGASQGMFVLGGSGDVAVSMFIYGIKIFDFGSEENTILSGQGAVSGNLEIDEMMDTQYEYKLNC